MFNRDELCLLSSLKDEYTILISNGHDVRLWSSLTGHEWIIISPYDGSACEILHRHSMRNSFHHQHGQYMSLADAYDYIQKHDIWYCQKHKVVANRSVKITTNPSSYHKTSHNRSTV